MTNRTERGERAFRWLLALYPKDFRDEYASDLAELFRLRRDQRLESHGRLGLGFWRFITMDVATSAWRERWDLGDPRPRPRGDGLMGWIADFAYAGRRLVRSPGFSAVALTILVLGVGVNTTAFSLVNSLLLQPPPFAEPERVVLVLQDSDDGRPNSTSFPAYLDIARDGTLFEAVAAHSTSEAFVGQDDGLVPVIVEYATAGYLDVVGLPPSRGRWFDALEDDPAGPPAAVLSHRWWRNRLGSDPAALGSTLQIGGGPVTVVGIGPEEFSGGRGPLAADMWLSVSSMQSTGGPSFSLQRRQDHPFTVRARMRPGVTAADVVPAMDRLAETLASTYPELNEGRRIHVIPASDLRPIQSAANTATEVIRAIDPRIMVLRSSTFEDHLGETLVRQRMAARILAVLGGLALVLALLGVYGLVSFSVSRRRREVGIRMALGAGRASVVLLFMKKVAVVVVTGAAIGLALALPLVSFVGQSFVGRDGSPLLTGSLALGLTVTALVATILPASRAARTDPKEALTAE